MKFIVNQPLQKKDTSSLPKYPKEIVYLNKKKVTATRFITLAEFEDPMFPLGMPMHINGRPFMGSTITETPHLGDTEIWNFINLSPDVHPMHMHLINYQVLDKIPFNVDA